MNLLAAPELPKQLQNNTVVLYVLLVVFVLGILISFVASKLPVVGKTIDAWNTRRRRSAKATQSARLADMHQELGHFKERLGAVERDNEQWRQVLAVHRIWDYEAMEAYLQLRAGQTPAHDLPMPPPPLYPPNVTTP